MDSDSEKELSGESDGEDEEITNMVFFTIIGNFEFHCTNDRVKITQDGQNWYFGFPRNINQRFYEIGKKRGKKINLIFKNMTLQHRARNGHFSNVNSGDVSIVFFDDASLMSDFTHNLTSAYGFTSA